MDLSWLKTVAPTLATALGGPLAGVAVEAVGAAFGWSDATREKVEAALTQGQLSGEQILALKKAELDVIAKERELGFKFADLEVADRKDARAMQSATRSMMPAVLTVLVVVGFFAILAGMMAGVLEVKDSQALLLMLGSLTTGYGMAMAFWFGSTRDSQDKTQLLAKAQPIK